MFMAKSKQQAVVNINYSIELLFMCIVDGRMLTKYANSFTFGVGWRKLLLVTSPINPHCDLITPLQQLMCIAKILLLFSDHLATGSVYRIPNIILTLVLDDVNSD